MGWGERGRVGKKCEYQSFKCDGVISYGVFIFVASICGIIERGYL